MIRPAAAHGHPHPHAHRLVRWQRQALYLSGTLLLITGIAWLAWHYTVGAGVGELPHPLEAWSLRVHGLAAFGSLFVLGALAAAHIPQGWRLSHRQRRASQRMTGLMLSALAGLLVLSGYLLYYFASEALRPALGWAHAAVGTLMVVLTAFHRRGARQAAHGRTPPKA